MGGKNMNKQQKAYLQAKAVLETLELQERELEYKYILDHNIINEDGSIPKQIFCIDNDEVFDKANQELAKITEQSGLWQKILDAREILKQAENDLIEYGLSIIPTTHASEKETLTRASKTDYTTRKKIIDLVFRLDTSTVTV